ncbi:MAG TPA: diguanylate cyclase, partial [Sphaerochaeta sp.]|nr:diguanylate cyclase [Sphaerochaeta sp.]
TDGYHHLIRASISIQETAHSLTLVVEPTVLAKLFISFNFVFTFVAFGIFSLYTLKNTAKFRKHNIAIFIGMLIATIYSLLRIIKTDTLTQVTPIPGVFAVSALFMLLGVYRYDLLRIAPLAHEQVFHFLGDGLIIASAQGKIIEANQAALSMIGPTFEEVCTTILAEAPQWYEMVSQGREGELSFYKTERFFTSNVYTIKSKRGVIIGTISLLKDNTEQKLNNDLLKARAELDGLTGIYNRHTFIEKVEKRLLTNRSGNSLVFFDLDNFKLVNDRYGHMSGDRVLQAIVACASKVMVGSDVMGRMGGEEFAIFHATENKEETLAWAENLRKRVQETEIHVEGNTISCTISIGLCFSKTASFDDLYRNADRELYKAKDAGRNCIRYTYLKEPSA